LKSNLYIAILGTRGIPNRYGGFEAFAEELSVRMVRRGHRVKVFCPSDQSYQDTHYEGVELSFQTDPVHRFGTAGQFVYDLNCNLHSREDQPDIVLHLGYTSDSVWYWLWSGKSVHITNMDGMEWRREKYSAPVRSFLRFAESLAAHHSHTLVADSRAVEDYLRLHYKTPVSYISYGAVIPDAFDPDPLSGFGVFPGKYDCLVARAEPENNLDTAIRAKLCDGTGLPLVIFSNNNSYRNDLKRRYSSESLIRFEEPLYDRQKLDAMRHFSRYYLHGHSAGGTNPSLLEAMACRCRIVAHDNVFNRSVLGSNACYFNNAGQLSALLAHDPDEVFFHTSVNNNLETISVHHSWELITDQYEALFQDSIQLFRH
jgi:glycosyltransferase involved in cell wall biosynthesis